MYVRIGVILLFTVLITTCYGQRCDDNQLRRCKDDVRRQNDRRPNDLSSSECRKYREDFDCLIDQTIMCVHRESEKTEYGNDIAQAHTMLQRICNQKEGWDRNRCYERDEIRRCEDNFPRRVYNADTETCRKYQELKDCVERIVDNYCSRGDRAYLRSYYMDIARDLPWKCALSTTSPGYPPGPGRHPDDNYDNNNYRNNTRGNEQICCKYERCDDRDRMINCREELIRSMDGRSSAQPYSNNREQCRRSINAFNCLLWHTYNCQQSHEKDSNTLQRGKNYVEAKCDTVGDLRRSRCYDDPQMRDCERYLKEETQSLSDVTCREYATYIDCVERQLRRCDQQDELLQGIYLVNKVNEKAWTCSKKDTGYTGYTTYDGRHTNPYDPYSTGGSTDTDDYSCELRARRDHKRCMDESDMMDAEARRETNNREKHVKGCCVAYSFRECTRQVVRQVCQRERSTVVDALMGVHMNNRIRECQDVQQSTCSASRMLNNAIIIVLAVAIFRSIFQD